MGPLTDGGDGRVKWVGMIVCEERTRPLLCKSTGIIGDFLLEISRGINNLIKVKWNVNREGWSLINLSYESVFGMSLWE